MSRQTTRQELRRLAKLQRRNDKFEKRVVAKSELRSRQNKRELSGYYTGLSVALCIAPSRSRIASRKVQKGKAFGRVIHRLFEDGKEIHFHATKGRREYRA